jgi:DNA invertase Pin-like site-specific DNA recombinase
MQIDIAYSYIRFSTPEQRKGNSLPRQLEAAADWCLRNGARLDEKLSFRDLGTSGFTGEHRKNPDRNALAAFLRMVEQGKIPKGSYLIIENLDRLTREHIRPALTLLLNLIEAGIRVVQLKPVEQVYDEHVEPMVLMMAIMELARGHGESLRKSDLIGKAWAAKKRQARERLVTTVLPGWVRLEDDRLELIPERAAVVKRIFHLAGSGYGLKLIGQILTREGVPPFGPSGRWTRGYLHLILTDRRVLGEYQPMKGKSNNRKKDGEPVAGYFPAVIDEDEFVTVQGCIRERKKHRGRVSDKPSNVNPFAGLLKEAATGEA